MTNLEDKAIEVSNLVFEYPAKRVLHGISFEIAKGSVTALVGPNGAGKTTLLRCLSALSHPFSGSVEICGINTEEDPRKIHSLVGYLADFFGLYHELTVYQSLFHMASVHGISDVEIPTVISETLTELDLENLRFVQAGALSRGQRQRLAIGMAIIHKPPVLILDEPAAGLDPEARHSLSALILRMKARGMTIIVSSHILSELEDYSDYMLTVNEGRILGNQRIGETAINNLDKVLELRVVDDVDGALKTLSSLGLPAMREQKPGTISFHFKGDLADQSVLLKKLVDLGVQVSSFSDRAVSMQQVYLSQMKAKVKE